MGWPKPRSIPSDNAASSSAMRTRAVGAFSPTGRRVGQPGPGFFTIGSNHGVFTS